MSNWHTYKGKKYTQNQARKMDYELDILHGAFTALYENDEAAKLIKTTLDKIERVVHSKPDTDHDNHRGKPI